MKHPTPRPGTRLAALGLAAALASLLAMQPAWAQTSSAAISPAGRLLASNCFQCHGTNGKGPGFESLAGRSAKDLYEGLRSFQLGKEGDSLMARHAMGYSDAQLRALAQWLAAQR